MRWLTITIAPASAFGTPLKGDTLFGRLCWALRHRAGEAALEALLEGYTEGRPFLVVSDALPHGLVPRPELPPPARQKPGDRKAEKKKRFLPLSALSQPMSEALASAAIEGPKLRKLERDRGRAGNAAQGSRSKEPGPDASQAACKKPEEVSGPDWTSAAQPHVALSRETGTSGLAPFTPYQMERRWPHPDLRLDIYLLFDPARLERALLETALADIGAFGFGRDASIGLGRFRVEGWAEGAPTGAPEADALLALAPCAAPAGFDPSRSFWKPFVRFGRHGAEAAYGNPFKKPVLLMETGAVLAAPMGAPFAGRGLGGNGTLSSLIPGTVHQGYAPVVPIRVGKWA